MSISRMLEDKALLMAENERLRAALKQIKNLCEQQCLGEEGFTVVCIQQAASEALAQSPT